MVMSRPSRLTHRTASIVIVIVIVVLTGRLGVRIMGDHGRTKRDCALVPVLNLGTVLNSIHDIG